MPQSLSEWIDIYVARFNENFPIFFYNAMSDEEIVEVIKSALDKGERLKPDYKKGVKY